MTWSSSNLDYKSLIHEASLSAAAAADETTASVPTSSAPAAVPVSTTASSAAATPEAEASSSAPAAVPVPKPGGRSFGASAVKGDGTRLMFYLWQAGFTAEETRQRLSAYSSGHLSSMMASFARLNAEATPAAAKKCGDGGAKLAKQCVEHGLNALQCRKVLRANNVKPDYVCKLIKKHYKMPIRKFKKLNPEATSDISDFSGDEEPAAPADTETSDASESSDEELATVNASSSSSAASGSGLTPEQRALVPTVGETTTAADTETSDDKTSDSVSVPHFKLKVD